jgi:hypothetical protein
MKSEAEKHDFLFNWKDDQWPHTKLRKLIDRFETTASVRDTWRCSAHTQVQPGDRAYLLAQGGALGIFGRGHIAGKARKSKHIPKGTNPWYVPIQFDMANGDVLFDPWEHFLVEADQLSQMPASQRFKMMQKSGESLDFDSARQIDRIIDSVLKVESSPVTEAEEQVARQKRIGELATRPDQQAFSERLRRLYNGKCALTGCVTAAALQAAHISTKKDVDDNNASNGILLRSDIHALLMGS